MPECSIPSIPEPPELVFVEPCPDTAVCLSPQSAASLSVWVGKVRDTQEAIEGCPPAQPGD